jgi:chromosome segregation ATPase
MAAILSQVMPEGVPAFVQEENRRLMEKITVLEQENKSLSKQYEELHIQHTDMESKAVEPSEVQDPHLQERISMLEQDNTKLIQENQKLNAQIVSFQPQLEKITALEQENESLSKQYEELHIQHTDMESKAVEPSEVQDPHLQERITTLEQDNKRLIQENQKLNAQIVSFQTQFGGKETEWKTVAVQMAEEMAARANTSTEDVLRHFEAPGYY